VSDEIEKLKLQLVEMQTQLAFQEDTINTLNGELLRQQNDLERLTLRFDNINEQLVSAVEQMTDNTEGERPPHY
jgi:SlyX protein